MTVLDPLAALRAAVGDLAPAPAQAPQEPVQLAAGALPNHGAGCQPEATTGRCSASAAPLSAAVGRGDIVSWLHAGRPQVGAVNNVADGVAWVRRLDNLRTAVPVPLDAMTVVFDLLTIRAVADSIGLSS